MNSYSVHCGACGACLHRNAGADLRVAPLDVSPGEAHALAESAIRHLRDTGHDVRRCGVEIIAHWRMAFAALEGAEREGADGEDRNGGAAC